MAKTPQMKACGKVNPSLSARSTMPDASTEFLFRIKVLEGKN